MSSNIPERRLVRPQNGRVLAGVLSGLALYYGWNILLLRILWILFGGLGGSGIMLYLILWAVIPSE
jgi:phage shock protein PspC (stress-responsive transcriptional regulator)